MNGRKLIYIFVMLLIVATTYKVKYEVQHKLIYYSSLQQKLAELQQQLHLLQIEKALLTQPDHLMKLSLKYQEQLKLAPSKPSQFIKITDLPFKEEMLDAER